jgi:hypothetical protein
MKVKKWKNFLGNLIMNFKYAAETYSIVPCSTRDTSPHNLCIMTLPTYSHFQEFFNSQDYPFLLTVPFIKMS